MAAPPALDDFCRQLVDSSLLTAVEVEALRQQSQPADAEQFARWLVQQQKLTAFQAQQCYAGKGQSLICGNYRILDKLGQGGMGLVLKAEHRRMKRVVALKVLAPNIVKTPEMLARFQREVQAVARLEHSNIVAAYDADVANGMHFFVMQYIDGDDLSSIVKSMGPLPLEQAVNCVVQAARGLEYAHRHGVIHRDIKPGNLLLDAQGTVKILDMGLARIEGETGAQAELTNTGAVMGTVDYMAPEQALNTKAADARSDVYSLGVTLWYLLTARPMYDGDSLMARLIAHREFPVPSLVEALAGNPGIAIPGLPVALNRVFQKMVAKNPAERYQTMLEVIAALEAVLRGDAPAPVDDNPLNALFAGLSSGHGDTVRTQEGTATQPTTSATAADAITASPNPGRRSSPAFWRDQRVQIGSALILVLLLTAPFWRSSRDPATNVRTPVTTGLPATTGPNEQQQIREALKWLRNAGGWALVHANGEEVRVDHRTAPPLGQLTVIIVDLTNAFGISGADLGQLKDLPAGYMLTVPAHLSETEVAAGLRLVPNADPLGIVNVDPEMTPKFGQALGDHPVRYLILTQRQIQPGSLAALAKLPNMSSLLLQQCEVTPEVLAEVKQLPHLGWLNLEKSTVTDEHLAVLTFPRPVNLSLFATGVTAAGIVDYLRRNPGSSALDGASDEVTKQVQQLLNAEQPRPPARSGEP
ncbi:MAG: serine/threonine-protein kinase [Planctomycetaceae bacterium]|nr:serine/threonine-protein kinase [Planctomycetaceae bacterium]